MNELGHSPTIYQLIYELHKQPLGRRTLVTRTGITEMTVRTHLNKLRAVGLVTVAKGGTRLTAHGRKTFAQLIEKVLYVGELKLRDLALDRHNEAVWIRGAGDAFQESWRYRDAAVREGATGAILLIHRPEGWRLSDDVKPLAKQNPHDSEHLQRMLPALPGDGTIIAFGPTRVAACRGLWSVLVDLFPTKTRKESKQP